MQSVTPTADVLKVAAAHGDDASSSADPMVTIIKPRPGWQVVDLGELWRYRELLGFLVWRDVKVRYKQTVLGAAWAILQPFAQMIVLSIFFGRIAQMPTGGMPYPLFVFAGLLPWIFFSNAITSAAGSVISNQNLITKIYFPRLFVPASSIGVGIIDFAIAFAMLLAMMVYYQVAPSPAIVLAVPILIGLTCAALGIGIFLAALTVAYRDFRYVVPFMVQIWMFATPTIYMQSEAVSDQWRMLLPINPAYGFILNFRHAILGGPLDYYALGISALVTVLMLLIGALYFRRVERTFADII